MNSRQVLILHGSHTSVPAGVSRRPANVCCFRAAPGRAGFVSKLIQVNGFERAIFCQFETQTSLAKREFISWTVCTRLEVVGKQLRPGG